jgi:hypothetical protein
MIQEAEIFNTNFFQANGIQKVLSDILSSEIRKEFDLLKPIEALSSQGDGEKKLSPEERKLKREAKRFQTKLQREEDKRLREEKRMKIKEKKIKPSDRQSQLASARAQEGEDDRLVENTSKEYDQSDEEGQLPLRKAKKNRKKTTEMDQYPREDSLLERGETTEFANLSIIDMTPRTRAPTTQKYLILDALYFSSSFFSPKEGWSCGSAMKMVSSLVKATQSSDWKLQIFLNEYISSIERQKKWKTRCSLEVKRGICDQPPGLAILLRDLFESCQVEVFSSCEEDAMASYAQHVDGDIISGDKNLFRFIGRRYLVYSDFKVMSTGLLRLKYHKLYSSNHRDDLHKLSSCLPLRESFPSSQLNLSNDTRGFNYKSFLSSCYLIGSPSPLVRQLGINPYETIGPLRHALYSLIGNFEPITEIWPIWSESESCVCWRETNVLCSNNSEMMELLFWPHRAVEYFFPEVISDKLRPTFIDGKVTEEEWRWTQHCFGVRSLVYEICSIASNSAPERTKERRSSSLLELMLEGEEAH